MRIINVIFYGAITFILLIAVIVFYFFGNKFLENENDLIGEWKIEKVISKPIEAMKYRSKAQKQALLQRDSILHSKKDLLFLFFEANGFIFRDTNNGKLETNFFETDKPIAWHYSKANSQITLYRHKEPDVFWEIIELSNSNLIIKTNYGNRKWIVEFSRIRRK